jgi:hypothetical protein
VNWEAIAAASEFVGVIAVVISLVYVAHEVRSNTKALQASAGFDSTQGMALLNEGLVHAVLGDAKYQQGAESRFLQVIAKVYDPEGSIKEMTLSDQAVVGLLSRAVFQRIEGEFYLWRIKTGRVSPQLRRGARCRREDIAEVAGMAGRRGGRVAPAGLDIPLPFFSVAAGTVTTTPNYGHCPLILRHSTLDANQVPTVSEAPQRSGRALATVLPRIGKLRNRLHNP